MSDPLAFLDGKQEEEAQATETAVEAQPEPQADPVSVEPEPTPEPIKEEVAADPRVPLAALHEERFKRQEEERKRFEAEQRAAYLEQFVQPQEEFDIDPIAAMQAQMRAQTVHFSKELAKQTYGAELVEKVHEWAFDRCNKDPYFNQKMNASLNPYADAVAEYQREQIASTVKPDEFQAFLAWKASQGQQPIQQAVPIQAAPTQPGMTSLKSIAQAGGVKVPRPTPLQSEQETFSAVFP